VELEQKLQALSNYYEYNQSSSPSTTARSLVTRAVTTPATRSLGRISSDYLRISFKRCVNTNCLENLPKSLDKRMVISSTSHSFHYEHNDSIKLEIVNLHPFNISFEVYYKSHESKMYSKLELSPNQTLQAGPNHLENLNPLVGSHVGTYTLPVCLLPESIKVHEVPATDLYLIVVWSHPTKEHTLKLVHKVYIYNENQNLLEQIKDKELDEKAKNDTSLDEPEIEEALNQLNVSENVEKSKILKTEEKMKEISPNQSAELIKLKGMGFSDEAILLQKLKENGGDLDKTVASLVNNVN